MRLIKYYIADDPNAAGVLSAASPALPPAASGNPALPGASPMGDPGGGGGGNAPAAPKGYAVTTPKERSDWNGFLDFASKQGNANVSDPKQQAALLGQYKKANPDFSITSDRIPAILYEAYQLRKGDSFGNLGSKELGYIRQGMQPNFLNADTSNIGKLYYPQEGSYGTDVENYYNSKFNPAAAKPLPIAAAAGPASPALPGSPAASPTITPAGAIQRPDYTDPTSRLNYAKQIVQKYGPLMKDYGDTFLHLDETPRFGSSSTKDIATTAAQKVGIDPALLYTSAMIEGMSSHVKTPGQDYNYDPSGNTSKHPVNSSADFGLDQIRSEIPRLQAKGYLDTKLDYVKHIHPQGELGSGGKPVTQNDVDFKSDEDGMAAKAAFLKDNYDQIDDVAKKNGIPLSAKARDFFALVNYNAGPGVGARMMADYNKNGYLKNDAFLNARPTKGEGLKDTSYGPTYDKNGKQTSEGVYTNILRRIKIADALHQEKLFDSTKK